jgi:hypothetical protein
VIQLDADFARVIHMKGYMVFLTPEGECRGLCVKKKGSKGFEVHELQGGTSNVAFSYRIVGKRKDLATKRFPKVDMTDPVQPAAPRKGRRSVKDFSSILAMDRRSKR